LWKTDSKRPPRGAAQLGEEVLGTDPERAVESQHDLDGEVVEYERVPCRRCAGEEE
jgi:hypothetical protein